MSDQTSATPSQADGPRPPAAMSRAALGWHIGAISTAMIAVVAGMQYHQGRPWPMAIGLGLEAGLGGLACWGTYYLINRRRNGLILFVLGALTFNDPRRLVDPGTALTGVIVGSLMGLMAAGSGRLADRRWTKPKPWTARGAMSKAASVQGRWGWRSWLGPLVVFALAALVVEASAQIVVLPPAWRTFEFCQYAEIGRNLATEGAYNTRLIEPMALAQVDRDLVGPRTPGRWPVVDRYPLPAFVVGGLFRLFGATDHVAAWSNGLAVCLLASLLYAAARAWLGARWAWLVAVVWLANPACFGEFLLLGTPDVWFATILLAEILVWAQFDSTLARSEPGRVRWRWAVGFGILAGLCYLTRFNASIFVAVQFLILGLVERRWREALIAAGTALVVVSPVFWDTYRHFGRPTLALYSTWNLLDRIGAFRVEPWLYYQVPAVPRVVLDHLPGVGAKLGRNLRIIVGPGGARDLAHLDFLLPPALLGVGLGGGRGSAWRRATGLALGLFALQLVVFSGLRLELGAAGSAHNGRYFFWFVPWGILLGVATLRRVARQRYWGKLLVGVAVGAQLTGLAWGWVGWAGVWTGEGLLRRQIGQQSNLGHDPITAMVRTVVRPGETIGATQPALFAWCAGLRAVSLPADPTEVARLNQTSPTPLDYLYIDLNFVTIELDNRWRALVRRTPADPVTPWERQIRADYEFVLPRDQTQPLDYVLLRRRTVAPSALEIQFRP